MRGGGSAEMGAPEKPPTDARASTPDATTSRRRAPGTLDAEEASRMLAARDRKAARTH